VIETFFLVTVGALSLRHGVAFFSIGACLASLRQVRNGKSRFFVAIKSSGSSVGSSSIFMRAIPSSSWPLHVHPGTILTIDKRIGEFLIWAAVSSGGLSNLTAGENLSFGCGTKGFADRV
jgi:hypothetical protein